MAKSALQSQLESEEGLWDMITAPFRKIVSKPAKRVYLGIIFFLATIFSLSIVSVASYWIFYYNYVPQISLERVVHLQFGKHHPSGTASLGPELIQSQAYDVSVILSIPRSPANVAVGNFMIDLALLDNAHAPTANVSHPVARSRRSAILTYSSPLVDTARRLVRMPFYVFDWKREMEILNIRMMERVEFPRGVQPLPTSLRLGIESLGRMEFYSATVRFDARFTGLRWLMYNCRILSFLAFTSMFWATCATVTITIWLLLNSEFSFRKTGALKIEPPDSEDSSVFKEESDEEDVDDPVIPRELGKGKLGALLESEISSIKKEEEIEGSTMIEPLMPQYTSHTADEREAIASGAQSRSRSGSAAKDLQRRKTQVIVEDVDEA